MPLLSVHQDAEVQDPPGEAPPNAWHAWLLMVWSPVQCEPLALPWSALVGGAAIAGAPTVKQNKAAATGRAKGRG